MSGPAIEVKSSRELPAGPMKGFETEDAARKFADGKTVYYMPKIKVYFVSGGGQGNEHQVNVSNI